MADQRAGYSYVIYADVSGTYTILAGQTDVTVNGANNLLEVTGKEDYPDKQFIGGWLDDTIELTGAYLASDAAYAALDAARRAGTTIGVKAYLDGAAVESGSALVRSLSHAHPIEGKATANISLQITGGWDPV